MLNRIDRILIAVTNADAVAQRWVELLDARIDRTDTVTALGATRVVVSVGDAELEILQPAGPGPVSEHLSAGRGGPFAAGVATDDLDALRTQFDACGVVPIDLGEQLYLSGAALGIPGLDLVVSPHRSRDPVGRQTRRWLRGPVCTTCHRPRGRRGCTAWSRDRPGRE